MGRMLLLALIIALGMLLIFNCMGDNIIDQKVYDGQLVRMITLEDVIIKSYAFGDGNANIGGTISKGTIITVNCYDLICQFPDSLIYVERKYLAPAPPQRIEGDKSG